MILRTILIVVLVYIVLVATYNFSQLLSPPFFLVFGWIGYLCRVVPQVRIDGAGIATALVCVVGLAIGLHHFAGWLYAHNHAADTPGRWRWRWTTALLAVVVLMFVAGVAAIGVTHQTAWMINSPYPWFETRPLSEAALRNSSNNLRQIGIGVAERVEQVQEMPPGTTFNVHGRALHGWQTQLLPYIDQSNLYNQIDLAVSWDQPCNRPAFQTIVNSYRIPLIDEERDDAGYALSHYAGNVQFFGRDEPFTGRALDIKSASQTILAGEVTFDLRPWGHPVNYRDPGLGLHRRADGFGGPFKNTTLFVMLDASTVWLHDDISPEVLKQLAAPGPKANVDY
jgi:hypothetical protein